jgi:uncharacterized membrane protein
MNFHPYLALASDMASDASLVQKASPTYTGIFLGAGLAFLTALILFALSRMKDNGEKLSSRLDAQDKSMALVNEALAVLVSNTTPFAARLDAHDQRLSALDTSVALLKQALDSHAASSEQDRHRLRQEVRDVELKLRDKTGR